MNSGDIKTEFLVRSGKDTSSGWLTDTILNDWLSQSHRWCAGFKKWPMATGRTQTTYDSATEEWDFEGYRADSFRIMTIGGKLLKELNYEDYLIFKEDSPDANDRVWAEQGGLVSINTNIDASGTLVAWGQFQPGNFDITDETESTVFTEGNDEGNQAIIEEMLSYVDRRDTNEVNADKKHANAIVMLEQLNSRIENEQFQKQTHRDRGGIFERIDVVNGTLEDEQFKRLQF